MEGEGLAFLNTIIKTPKSNYSKVLTDLFGPWVKTGPMALYNNNVHIIK